MIEVIRGRKWDRPQPLGEAEYGTWFEALAEGRLLVQRCDACGHEQWYPRSICTACAATPGWREVSGEGEIYTFTIIRQYHGQPFAAELPYAVGMVQLADSPVRMIAAITSTDVDALRIGARVQAYAVEYSEGRALLYFRRE